MVRLNDAIEDGIQRLENLVRGIFAGNIFDLGSAQVCQALNRRDITTEQCIGFIYLKLNPDTPLSTIWHLNIWCIGFHILKLAEVFSRDGMSFLASCQNLLPRPWVIDDLDTFKLKWSRKSWKKASFMSIYNI